MHLNYIYASLSVIYVDFQYSFPDITVFEKIFLCRNMGQSLIWLSTFLKILTT